MSKLLKDLIEHREGLRAQEIKLTKEIKAERKAIAAAKKIPQPPTSKQIEMHKQLRDENSRLRGLVALLKRAEGSTYKEVGDMLGVSGDRAVQLVSREQSRLRWDERE